MKIVLDIDYEEAVQLRDLLHKNGLKHEAACNDINDALIAEDERRGVEHAEQLLESGGVDDSQYRRDMVDAGRSYLLR